MLIPSKVEQNTNSSAVKYNRLESIIPCGGIKRPITPITIDEISDI